MICSKTKIAIQFSSKYENSLINFFFIFLLGFTPCKAEQPLQGMELQEKETQKD